MAAETINELTTGVLTQAISAGGSLFTNQLAGYQDRGAVSGNVLIRDFRTRNAISFTQAQSICNALMQDAGTRVWELHAENAAEEVIGTFNFTVTPGSVEFFDHGPGGVPSRRYRCLFQINMTDFEEVADIWPTNTVTDSFEVTREQQFNRDITSHRNFNFNNTVTLDLIRNATQLGTNAAGMIVPSSDTPIRITTESDNPGPMLGFPANPNRGDYHILETQFTTTEGGIEPLMTVAALTPAEQVTFNTYIPAPFSVGQSFSGFDNIAFSHARGTIDPPLGVAGQPVEIHYRQSASDPWILVGTTTDSSPNGNQLRVRFEEGANFGNIQLNWEAGFRSGSGTAGQMFDPGTYIFDGDTWVQISGNTSMTASSGQYVDDIQFITDLNSGVTDMVLAYEGSGDTVREAVPDIWPLYLRTTNDFFNTVADRRRVALPQTLTADHVGQVLQVVEQANGIRNLEFTTPDAANITVEGNDGTTENNVFTGINRVDFNHNDFFVNTGDAGEVIITSRGGSGGGFLLREDGNAEVDVVQTLDFTDGFTVTPDNASSADATGATVSLDTTTIPYYQVHNFTAGVHDTATNPNGFFTVTRNGQVHYELRIARNAPAGHVGSWLSQPPSVTVYELLPPPSGFGSMQPTQVLPMSLTVTASNQIVITFTQNNFSGRVAIVGL